MVVVVLNCVVVNVVVALLSSGVEISACTSTLHDGASTTDYQQSQNHTLTMEGYNVLESHTPTMEGYNVLESRTPTIAKECLS